VAITLGNFHQLDVATRTGWGMTDRAATEQRDLETALSRVAEAEAFVQRLQARFRPFMSLRPGATVLDVGAAQGVTSAAYARAGFKAVGVEPWVPAIEVSRELTERLGVKCEIREGWAEHLPFDDGSIDLVHAYSLLEHVDDPLQVFREAFRVLRPGGGFYFATTSVLCPRQFEISGFPLFPWYPPRLQKGIMRWAAANRPALVGHTTRPAMHWFRDRATRLSLTAIGFERLVDKWELRGASGELKGGPLLIVRAAAANSTVRFAGNLAVAGTEYLAIK
jgi:2-polyprenyl-3-methyl-5-hydroxy-6-metoxy-1,4-benzoquinol methylase